MKFFLQKLPFCHWISGSGWIFFFAADPVAIPTACQRSDYATGVKDRCGDPWPKLSNHFASTTFQFQIMVFGSVWFWLVTVLLIVWPRSLLLRPIHLFIRNWEFDGRSPLVLVKQIIRDLVASCKLIHIDHLLVKICKQVNSVPWVSQQRRSPWLSALEIFHNNSCL